MKDIYKLAVQPRPFNHVSVVAKAKSVYLLSDRKGCVKTHSQQHYPVPPGCPLSMKCWWIIGSPQTMPVLLCHCTKTTQPRNAITIPRHPLRNGATRPPHTVDSLSAEGGIAGGVWLSGQWRGVTKINGHRWRENPTPFTRHQRARHCLRKPRPTRCLLFSTPIDVGN